MGRPTGKTPTYVETHLWNRTLGGNANSAAVEFIKSHLRETYSRMRERAIPIAQSIAADLPEFTLHDVSHLDALWELADLIIGKEHPVTPPEAFILGAAFLIHDLGMGLAAYPGGLQELKQETIWRDQVALMLRAELGRPPQAREIENPTLAIASEATRSTLRVLHARRAEELAKISWRDQPKDVEHFLIDDPELRNGFGPLIGKIAHSHWWPVSDLESAFPQVLGSPAFLDCPPQWTIDPLKIACILRTADAAHVDARRAPGYHRALKRPEGFSRDHWIFQEHLQKPQVIEDKLLFTAASPFDPTESRAWWQCLDSLVNVDAELRQVDALLWDTNRARFKVRSLAGVDDPKRLASLIPTRDWTPVDARLKVSNVVRLVDRLGGRELYGKDNQAALRELIQNAQDAINVRKSLDRTFSSGSVVVRLREQNDAWYLEVEDDGIGMSPKVLTGALLDFGNSFWDSQEVMEQFPGLLSSQFSPVGRFGIGFFSVFMLGDEVTVVSRRFDAARSDARAIHFPKGLTSRALLRVPNAAEELGGLSTLVRVRLKKPPHSPEGLLTVEEEYEETFETGSLEAICTWLCPAIQVDLYVEEGQKPRKKIASANDWLSIPPQKLIKRLWKFHRDVSNLEMRERFKSLQPAFRTLHDDVGNVVGRGCIFPDNDLHPMDFERGVVTVGGLRSTFLGSIAGVFTGNAITAARDDATILAPPSKLKDWITEQGQLISKLPVNDRVKMHAAAIVHSYGGKIGELPFCLTEEGYLTASTFGEWARNRDEIKIVSEYELDKARRLPGWRMDPVILLTDRSQANSYDTDRDTLGLRLQRDEYLQLPPRIRQMYLYSKHSLVEIVLSNLARVWDVTTISLFQKATMRWDSEVVVGTTDHGPVLGSADVFYRKSGKRTRRSGPIV
jgi:hypothetical protein